MWLEHPKFLAVVRSVWMTKIQGSPSFIVAEKLRRLQRKLKAWNWEVFGDIHTQLADTRTTIEALESRWQIQYVEADI